MKLKIRTFYCTSLLALFLPPFCFAQSTLNSTRPIVFTNPVELNWKQLTWQTINYNRTSIDGGAALYTLSDTSTLKFEIDFVFPTGVYSIPRQDRTSFSAMSDLLILGGFGNLNFEQIQNYLTEYGIDLQTSIDPYGNLQVSVDALKEDFPKALALLNALILKPSFRDSALPLWKQQAINRFENILDANTMEKQSLFIETQANILAFGKDHYFSSALYRISPKEIQKVSTQKVHDLYKKSVHKNGLNVSLSGAFTEKNVQSLLQLISLIPRSEPSIKTWLPSREIIEKKGKITTALIQKKDMTQSSISLRFYYPNLGKLNSLEKIQYHILQEIFSSTGGVVGNDRFSKALRADSGISYAPHAHFNDKALYPNSNVALYDLSFQSPNERLTEAVLLAKKTWDTFLTKGIEQKELDNTRTAMMNRLLATERTVFNKTDEFMSQIAQDKLPSVDPLESSLVALSQQTNVASLNHILKKLTEEKMVSVLVIMGNPDEKQIAALKKIEKLDLVSIRNLNSIVQ